MVEHKITLSPDWANTAAMNELALGVAKIYSRGVPGDVAEFGTMMGNTASSLAIGLALVEKVFKNKLETQMSRQRRLQLFDSFEGLPSVTAEPDLRSPPVMNGTWAPGTCKGISPDALRQKCAKFIADERVVISEGWFSETLPKLPQDSRFALIHIDCDLYSSTMDILDGLLGRGLLEPGALIYFDDWDCNASRPDLGERKAWADAVDKYEVEFSLSHPYAATGQAIIFHGCAALRAPVP